MTLGRGLLEGASLFQGVAAATKSILEAEREIQHSRIRAVLVRSRDRPEFNHQNLPVELSQYLSRKRAA